MHNCQNVPLSPQGCPRRLKEGASNPFSCLTASSTCTARVKPGLKFHRKVSACHVRLKNRVCCICKRCFWKQSTLRPPITMTLFKRFQHAKLRECPERLSNTRRPVVSTSAPSSALPSSNMVQGCRNVGDMFSIHGKAVRADMTWLCNICSPVI